MTFRVGQKVVCVRVPRGGYGDEIDPEVGKVYTIRELVPYPSWLDFRLVEIVNAPRPYCEGLFECSFHSKNFRPIVERKTSIEIFTRMLNPSKVEA